MRNSLSNRQTVPQNCQKEYFNPKPKQNEMQNRIKEQISVLQDRTYNIIILFVFY